MKWNILHLKETESTNIYAKNILNTTPLPALIYADYQTNGKGQMNNVWYSEANQNLLCTTILPLSFPAEKNNYISRWTSVILVELLKKNNIPSEQIQIKWPNDIIIQTHDGFKKIAGILIENIIEKNHITKSIIGIGLNVNQTNFLQLNKTATSIKLITQQNHSIETIVQQLIQHINDYYPLLKYQKLNIINEHYIHYLYGWQKEFLFQYQNQIHKGKIFQLNDDGTISVQTADNTYIFKNKDIIFLH